ncbi:MAG: hypothetical protein JST28_19325 [Acidobacteria bacterium]|nr:hypothetical protein [Acidobacteriota bacterium]
MARWPKAFRLMAMFLLLFAVVEVFACDLVPSDDCYISSHFPSAPAKGLGQGPGDTCLCCCQHMIAAIPLVLEPQETIAPTPPELTLQPPPFPPSNIEHPPQLS